MILKSIKAFNLHSISVEMPEVKPSNLVSFRYPEITECPICHHALLPTVLSGFFSSSKFTFGAKDRLFVICHCRNCGGVFVCEYWPEKEGNVGENMIFSRLVSVAPVLPKSERFSPEIQSLSPDFVETYTQANAAESQNLTRICGAGYRRALEYLVKDYLCHAYPDEAETIRSEFLGKAIRRIENEKIAILAQRSAWIGNDETHYIKKHEEAGLDEMKRFIRAILTYVESELALEAASSILGK